MTRCSMGWRTIFDAELSRIAPELIVALDASAFDATRTALPDTAIQLCPPGTPTTAPAQLAVVMAALEDLDATEARTLLSRVRDFIAPCILVIAVPHCALDRQAFLAMGYDTLGHDDIEDVTIYRHDLATYKPVPDWLNARYWAHPERWKA